MRASAALTLCLATSTAIAALAPAAHAAPGVESFLTAAGYADCAAILAHEPPPTTEGPAGSAAADAGAHRDVCARIDVTDGMTIPDLQRSLRLDLPPGLMANPNAVEKCPAWVIKNLGSSVLEGCPAGSQIGTATGLIDAVGVHVEHGAIYLVESGSTQPARLVVAFNGLVPVSPVTVEVRTESDFGINNVTPELSTSGKLFWLELFVWGVPNANQRGGIPLDFGDPLGPASPVATPAPPAEQKAFLTNPTVCDAPKTTKLEMTFLDDPNLLHTMTSADPQPTRCGAVPFEPSFDLQPTSTRADDAAGLAVDLGLPQTMDPTVLGTSHLRRAEVTLPEGTTFNPSAGDGLAGCSDEQFKLGTRLPAECPDAAKVGTLELDVPLLDGPLEGALYLGEPLSTDPQSGRMFRLFQVAKGFGMNVKIPGYAKADPVTGRITAVFGDRDADGQIDPGEGLPQVPFTNVHMEFKGGPRGVLATPSDCGVKTTEATFTPWAVPDPAGDPRGRDVSVPSTFVVSRDGHGAPCPAAWPFSPALSAGMQPAVGGAHGLFSFTLTRADRTQEIGGLTAELPGGLLAKVKGVPLCTNAQANANACPAGSQIGTVSAGSGAGAPLFLPGKAFLTEGYKGAPYGLSVAVPAKAGPFDLGTVVVRQAVHVDRRDGHVEVVSDPLPRIWHGIPLRLRSIGIDVDRNRFMLNPTDCAGKQVKAAVTSTRGATANLTARFQARACRALPFEPNLSMRLTGKRQTKTGKHPGIRATVTQTGIGEAGIERAEVRLPKSLALDPANAQALCEFEDGTRDDLESHCPKGSIVGRARAVSPLLNRPLTGNVYFVKNVRIHPRTGRRIATLPMIVAALRGEIAINLKGESNVKGGRLVNTFAAVPDAPISRFNLNIAGGRNGILAVTRTFRKRFDLCRGRHVAEVDMDGQNGRRHDFDVRAKTPCAKKKVKRVKR